MTSRKTWTQVAQREDGMRTGDRKTIYTPRREALLSVSRGTNPA